MRASWLAPTLLVVWCGIAGAGTEWLDRVPSVQRGLFRADLSGLLDVEGYYIDQRPPGLIFGGDASFVNPRLSLFLDTRFGRHLYGFVQARLDRGFDPRERRVAAHVDEYLVRYTPGETPVVNLQFGKFATIVGSWVSRHDSWNNPFVNAPLPYENVTIVSGTMAPAGPAAFLARRQLPDRKRAWVPIIWGPDYTSGGAVFGRITDFEYAVEVKNAALASRPVAWNPVNRGWDDPTTSARVGWHPRAAWTFGTSFSTGPYLYEDAIATLPRGQGLGDFRQWLVGADASWAWRHVQVWGEFFATRFEVPRVGDADSAAYYLEGRYKLTTALYGALRWNQQFFGDVPDGHGGDVAWDRDIWRVDAAVGYRLNRHLQTKLQYAYSHQQGRLQQGEQLVAAQVTLKF